MLSCKHRLNLNGIDYKAFKENNEQWSCSNCNAPFTLKDISTLFGEVSDEKTNPCLRDYCAVCKMRNKACGLSNTDKHFVCVDCATDLATAPSGCVWISQYTNTPILRCRCCSSIVPIGNLFSITPLATVKTSGGLEIPIQVIKNAVIKSFESGLSSWSSFIQ